MAWPRHHAATYVMLAFLIVAGAVSAALLAVMVWRRGIRPLNANVSVREMKSGSPIADLFFPKAARTYRVTLERRPRSS